VRRGPGGGPGGRGGGVVVDEGVAAAVVTDLLGGLVTGPITDIVAGGAARVTRGVAGGVLAEGGHELVLVAAVPAQPHRHQDAQPHQDDGEIKEYATHDTASGQREHILGLLPSPMCSRHAP
jgi:hypothetical protein